jgi:hypothetical protein
MVSYMAHLIPAFSARFKDQMQRIERPRDIHPQAASKREDQAIIASSRYLPLQTSSDRADARQLRWNLEVSRSSGRPSSLYRHRFGFWIWASYCGIIGVLILILYLRNSWHEIAPNL